MVTATTVAVTGGSHGGGDATATFSVAGSTLANLNVTGGSATGANAAVTFGNQLTLSGAVRLDEGGAGTSGAALTFSGSAVQTIAGTIDAQAQGEGTVHVLNTHASGTTFEGVIGGTQRLGRLNVGSTSAQGIATFNRV